MDIEEIKKKIVPVLQRYQVQKASIFGSIVRGEDTRKVTLIFCWS